MREHFSESCYADINGMEEFLYERGTRRENPLLLYLHGGPGIAFSNNAYALEKWEEHFTVVHYDQRGAGKTLLRNPGQTATLPILMDDLEETIAFLKKKYKKEKIVLLGHSFGSVLGMLYLHRRPEDIFYYIGVGQVVQAMDDERTGFLELKRRIQEKGDCEDLQFVEELGEYPRRSFDLESRRALVKVRALQAKYKIASSNQEEDRQRMENSPIFQEADRTVGELAAAASLPVYEEFVSFDLYQDSLNYEVPLYFLLGESDYQVPWVKGRDFLEAAKAPDKWLKTFPGACHRPMLEKKEEFYQALLETWARYEKWRGGVTDAEVHC